MKNFCRLSETCTTHETFYIIHKLEVCTMTKTMKMGLAVLAVLLIGASALLVNAITQQHAINEAEARAIAQRTIQGEISEGE
jgi:hypothetical protein